MLGELDAKRLYATLVALDGHEARTYMLEFLKDVCTTDNLRPYPWFKPVNKREAAEKIGASEEAFNIFWKAYPRKVGKGAALKVWAKIKMDKYELANLCLLALKWQCDSEQWTKDGGQFIPHPQTYLNQRRWEDEPPVVNHNQKVMGIAPSPTGRKMVL